MLCERMIAMEAVDRAANVFRAWRCEVGSDLLGAVVLSVRFGRKGADGRTIVWPVPDQAAAERLVRQLVARRAGAQRRIGVGYRVTETHGFEALDGVAHRLAGASSPALHGAATDRAEAGRPVKRSRR